MKVIIDTNIILDVLLERIPFFKPAVEIFCLVEDSKIEAFICATTVTTIDYLLTKSLPVKKARTALSHIISLFEIAPVNRPVIERALNSRITDFEEAVLEESGKIAGADCIITRNVKDFKYASIKVFEPIEFLALF
ncbi:MAG: PIN domain-containing protein [Deltaproteobacteria bacterium]|nr:PIN domain-containing protein [Deltaproteobacteria bacterium]